MNSNLHVRRVGNAQRRVDGGGRRAPILVQLETECARIDLLVAFPLPRNPTLTGSDSLARNI
jgi:hypothetical protein